MKKILLLSLVIFSILLMGCGSENKKQRTDNISISIYVDKETGVNYYIYHNGYAGGMTVRLSADGKPFISEVE